MAAATEALLRRVGIGPGHACLDVGCGQGQVAIAMARAVGASGRVVGLDVDAEALASARQAARAAGVLASFAAADAERPVPGDRFDIVYARLLLSHLVDPMAALRAMVAETRPGGVVAVEDLYLGTLRSDPPVAALDRLQQVYGATVRFHGGDPTIGPRLPAMLARCGLEDVAQETVVNPMRTPDEKLFLAQLVANMRAATIEAGAATGAEVDTLADEVAGAARDPRTVFFQARIHQVHGRRPA